MSTKQIEDEVINNLPPSLKKLVSHFEGRERDIVLLSALGVLSGCLPNMYGVYDGKSIHPNLYIMIIAPPASGKGVMNHSRKLVEQIHDKVLRESKVKRNNCKEKNKTSEIYVECPPIQTKIIPANISSAEIYSMIKNSHHGGIMIESEADTLSIMLSQDWGNFSDVLRKCFHHEMVSISRKTDDLYMEIKNPQLSLILTGTPDQLKPLVKSQENGLFSRFLYYTFSETSAWKNVFAHHSTDYEKSFNDMAGEVFELYDKLNKSAEALQFKFSIDQEKRFNANMERIFIAIKENHPIEFIQNLKRHGVMMFRISMIFSALRHRTEMFENKNFVCLDVDFDNALILTDQLLHHAYIIFENMDRPNIPREDEDFLFKLNVDFTRKEALALGKTNNMPVRTVDDKLKQWRRKKIIEKKAHGKYKRLIK